MAENTSKNELKRLDIVNYLEEKKIKPAKSNKNYATEYINYLCSKLSIENSEVPSSVNKDIFKIKTFYVECGRNVPYMIDCHKNFFNTIVKPIPKPKPKLPDPESSTSDTVCFKITIFLCAK